jgi:hypothetical protein
MRAYGVDSASKDWCASKRERHQAGRRTKPHQFRWVKRVARAVGREEVKMQAGEPTMVHLIREGYCDAWDEYWDYSGWEELPALPALSQRLSSAFASSS